VCGINTSLTNINKLQFNSSGYRSIKISILTRKTDEIVFGIPVAK
jgi:hypothetical protein